LNGSLQHNQDPLSLGIIGLMEVIPAISMALFAGHIVDQKEKKGLLVKCIFFFSNQFRTILLTWPAVVHDYSLKRFCTPSTFSFSWWISSSLLRTTIFSLLSFACT
jgi:hypothetical protein